MMWIEFDAAIMVWRDVKVFVAPVSKWVGPTNTVVHAKMTGQFG